MTDLLLVGPLAHPALAAALGIRGQAESVPGRLTGGLRAGIDRHGWPVLHPGAGEVAAIRTAMTPALARYAAVFGLAPLPHAAGRVMGAGLTGPDGISWSAQNWPAALAAGLARQVLAQPPSLDPAQIAQRLPQMAVWEDSRLRAAGGPSSGGDLVAPRTPGDVAITAREQAYAGFFSAEAWDLTHRRHDGGTSPQMRREGFVMGDAVCVLPWDKQRDRVLVVEQFRFAPAMRDDPQPWLIEPIAGRIDALETPEIAARREAIEEAGLTLGELIPAIHHYPSPGAVAEFLYLYVALADLPDGVAGIHGLAGEAEDIRGHLLDRADLSRMVMAGQITNGPLAMLSLWLDQRAEALRRDAD